MKKLLSLALACLLLFSLSACGREPKEEVSDEKPVIYLNIPSRRRMCV